jgi:hypothetical protein
MKVPNGSLLINQSNGDMQLPDYVPGEQNTSLGREDAGTTLMIFLLRLYSMKRTNAPPRTKIKLPIDIPAMTAVDSVEEPMSAFGTGKVFLMIVEVDT